MAPELLAQQRRELADAPTGLGSGAVEAVRPALLEAGESHQAVEACDIRVRRATHGACAWCWTHQALVGAIFGTEPFTSRRVAAWRGPRRCEA